MANNKKLNSVYKYIIESLGRNTKKKITTYLTGKIFDFIMTMGFTRHEKYIKTVLQNKTIYLFHCKMQFLERLLEKLMAQPYEIAYP